ncbi:uncharacterized protein LOC125468530 isoform X2 [Pyrus x bretschneideri]|uniref:uncharacterized protein LOC125468530 isoform X2 n=1 Tax=Pyrus x bretschneideri TaxID=225117 RepID=UPI002030DB98|nr:uncharacterized protein LOC125468530 isoform X2 [Pyrus x bretschneideri]
MVRDLVSVSGHLGDHNILTRMSTGEFKKSFQVLLRRLIFLKHMTQLFVLERRAYASTSLSVVCKRKLQRSLFTFLINEFQFVTLRFLQFQP